MNLLAGQDEYETLETFFDNVDLSFAENLVRGCFHVSGPGRPPRNPLGLFRAFIVMRMKGVRSLREMARLLNVDPRLRKLCLIKGDEKGYPRSVLSRFTKRVGSERLKRIMDEKVVRLLKRNKVKEVAAVLDASFIKAWSIRHPLDSRKGYSDREAKVGRKGRTYGLGYKLHLSLDSERRLPLASLVAPANQNEKKHSLTMVERTKRILRKAGTHLRRVIADSQYSSKRVREAVDEAVIPYHQTRKAALRAS